MVKGLEIFREHFKPINDSFVIIGGTACSILMEKEGLTFRATRDIDIVLQIEVLDETFFRLFKDFIDMGRYQHIQKSTGKKVFFRFEKPEENDFPAMIELFSRKPDEINIQFMQKITVVPAPEEVSDLSAILMNDEYYSLVTQGKTEVNGLQVVSAQYLIPLKAHAWLNLIELSRNGVHVDAKDILKHKKDVFRLSQLLSPDEVIPLPPSVLSEFKKFLGEVEKEPFELKDIGVRSSFNIVLDALRSNYAA